MDHGQFQYDPISNASTFRLFIIHPVPTSRSEARETRIDLFDTSLDDPPRFDAVSYAWDGQQATEPIVCNGKTLLVTANVIKVLGSLRILNPNGVFWIDSICIDQSSAADKNAQVPNMGSIYRQATNVWIYLGIGSYQTDAGFDFLKDILSSRLVCNKLWSDGSEQYISLLYSLVRPRKEAFDYMVASSRGSVDGADTHFVHDILSRAWFDRTWPVQELVLASSPTLLCGRRTIPWSDFITALKILQDFELHETLDPGLSGYLYDRTRPHRELERLVKQTQAQQHSTRTKLHTILSTVRTKYASEPRDKVYALYGILEELGVCGLPEIDYLAHVEDVYTEITKATIIFDDSLDILKECCVEAQLPNLPSWVPDWSNSTATSRIGNRASHASGNSMPSFSLEGSHLLVSGVFIDAVYRVAESASITSSTLKYRRYDTALEKAERHTARVGLIRTLQAWIVLFSEITTIPTGEPLRDSFCFAITQSDRDKGKLGGWNARTIMHSFSVWIDIITANLSMSTLDIQVLRNKVSHHEKFQANKEGFVNLFGCSEDLEDWADEMVILLTLRCCPWKDALVLQRIQDIISQNTYQKTFFTTQAGYMALGPRWSAPEDKVVLISGVDVPFVIRKSEVSDSYQLIGPAYIHGIMNGELWTNDLSDTKTIRLV